MTQLATRPVGNGAISKDPMRGIKELFEASRQKIMSVAPKHVTPERLIRVALLSISRTPALIKCTPLSLLNAFMTSSQLGLEIGGTLGEAYLVPFGQEATFIPGYRGLQELARRGSNPVEIEAEVVREGDDFYYERGLTPKLVHKPNPDQASKPTHFYAIGRPERGEPKFIVMTKAQVDAVRARSRASNNGPWVTDYDQMGCKTVARRLCKWLPLSPELREAVEIGDRAEFEDMVDVEAQVAAADDKAERRQVARKADRLAAQLADKPADPDAHEQPPEEPVIDRGAEDFAPPAGAVGVQAHEVEGDMGAELDVSGADAEPPTMEEKQEHPPEMSGWEKFIVGAWELAESLRSTRQHFDAAVKKSLLKAGKIGKEEETDQAWRDGLIKAIKDRAGVFAYLDK